MRRGDTVVYTDYTYTKRYATVMLVGPGYVRVKTDKGQFRMKKREQLTVIRQAA